MHLTLFIFLASTYMPFYTYFCLYSLYWLYHSLNFLSIYLHAHFLYPHLIVLPSAHTYFFHILFTISMHACISSEGKTVNKYTWFPHPMHYIHWYAWIPTTTIYTKKWLSSSCMYFLPMHATIYTIIYNHKINDTTSLFYNLQLTCIFPLFLHTQKNTLFYNSLITYIIFHQHFYFFMLALLSNKNNSSLFFFPLIPNLFHNQVLIFVTA